MTTLAHYAIGGWETFRDDLDDEDRREVRSAFESTVTAWADDNGLELREPRSLDGIDALAPGPNAAAAAHRALRAGFELRDALPSVWARATTRIGAVDAGVAQAWPDVPAVLVGIARTLAYGADPHGPALVDTATHALGAKRLRSAGEIILEVGSKPAPTGQEALDALVETLWRERARQGVIHAFAIGPEHW